MCPALQGVEDAVLGPPVETSFVWRCFWVSEVEGS